MIDYGSDDDVAQLIAHKLSSASDIHPDDVMGKVARVLAMMGHRPNNFEYVVSSVKAILTKAGKINEGELTELSLAQLEDPTVHDDDNEDAALYLRAQMKKYPPINMERAIKLVHRKYDGEKTSTDIHDILLRFVKYLKLDDKFIAKSVNEIASVHSLAAEEEEHKKRQINQDHQRQKAEEMDKEKKMHQVANRNIRGDGVTIEEASKHRKYMNDHFKRARQYLYGFPVATCNDCDNDHDADDVIAPEVTVDQGDTGMSEAEELESTDGADGTISQDGDELTETAETCTMKSSIMLDGEEAIPVEVTYSFDSENDDFPVDIQNITRTDTGDTVDPQMLDSEERHMLMFACLNDYNSINEVDECNTEVSEAFRPPEFKTYQAKDGLNIKTKVWIKCKDAEDDDDVEEIAVTVKYHPEREYEPDESSYVTTYVDSVISDETGENVMSDMTDAEYEELQQFCYEDYQKYVHYQKYYEESVDYTRVNESSIKKVTRYTLELPVDDIYDPIQDVDVTVEYMYEYINGHREEPDEHIITILNVVRDDTGEDITKSLTDYQKDLLQQGCLDMNDKAEVLTSHDPYQEWKDREVNEDDEDDLSDSEYLDKRVADYEKDAGSGPAKGKFVVYGRTFDTYVFDTPAQANAFMEENSGWGFIGEDPEGKFHLAKIDDDGQVEESTDIVKVPRDQQKSLEDEIDVGGRDGEEQQLAYIKRMKALAGLK